MKRWQLNRSGIDEKGLDQGFMVEMNGCLFLTPVGVMEQGV